MNIAILGTRGIPNNYGGFEQFAEYLSLGLVALGHNVTVYNSSRHPYKNLEWNGIKIIHKFDPEDSLGTAGQFIYDLNCILDSRKRNFDIILQLGYTSSSVWGKLLPKNSIVVTNMDGLEWKRSKYSKGVQKFLKKAEKWAINTSDYLISDSIGIQKYLVSEHAVESEFIPYGATLFDNPDFSLINKHLGHLRLSANNYEMLIARFEPENNLDMILEGKKQSQSSSLFVVVGNYNNKYGHYLINKYSSDYRIKFVGGIYNLELLNNLRFFSKLYFHGHSVGGTNPSLLEAMASSAFICAHDNIFNKAILEDDALYFTSASNVRKAIEELDQSKKKSAIQTNSTKIKIVYSWDIIVRKYEAMFTKLLKNKERDYKATELVAQ